MLTWLWFTLPVALLLSRVHPRIWIVLDVKRFVQDGAANSLLRVFHRQRATWRVVIGALICALATWPLHGHRWPLVCLVLAVATWQAAYWVYYFNPALNLARKLSYVGEFHVSWVADASWLDRRVWARAAKLVYPDFAVTHEPDPAIIAVAGPLYKKYLTRCIWGGAVLSLTFTLASSLLLLVGK